MYMYLACARGKQRKGLLDRGLKGKKSTSEASVVKAVGTGERPQESNQKYEFEVTGSCSGRVLSS